ncbi:hypothetical protein M422DRAFT_257441 [Sphaerobolus stellatus SS14]|uniref:Uncharacterized protein n=1 Tax=Sphaerobolus stellatus (strain SS14) TaxID=990650 RepID=A0A0C9VP25_SPHS4|nr:hypothetical protein M422DRAFT_257441 [Sphaerobolus stellatus SS14]
MEAAALRARQLWEEELPKERPCWTAGADIEPIAPSGVGEHREGGTGAGREVSNIKGLTMLHDGVASGDITRIVARATRIPLEAALNECIIGLKAVFNAVGISRESRTLPLLKSNRYQEDRIIQGFSVALVQ